VQLAQRDREQPIGREGDALFELQLRSNLLAAEPERRLGPRRQVGLQIVDVGGDGRHGLGGRVGEVAQDVQVVERRERAREVRLDEREHAPPGLEAHLDEDARGSLMLSRAACTSRGTCRSLETTRRARSAPGA
jgi:hypothetical protein